MANKASEELLAAPLPELIRDLGLAVATANKQLKAVDETMDYTINDAEIELRIAISIDTSTEITAGIGANISVFNVNASYSRTYGFKEEASSRILLKLAARPRSED